MAAHPWRVLPVEMREAVRVGARGLFPARREVVGAEGLVRRGHIQARRHVLRQLGLGRRDPAQLPPAVPAMFIKGAVDEVTLRETFEPVPSKFDSPFELVGLPGVGHFPQPRRPKLAWAWLQQADPSRWRRTSAVGHEAEDRCRP